MAWPTPSRAEVEAAFEDVIHGARSREDVAMWAGIQLQRDAEAGDVLPDATSDALATLTGLDQWQVDSAMNRTEYLFTDEQVVEWLDEFRATRRRPLSPEERGTLLKALSVIPDSADLMAQARVASVADDSIPTYLDLEVPPESPRSTQSNGPLPGFFAVVHRDEYLGELLVWMKEGVLSGLEYAWVTDEAPSGMPHAEDLTVMAERPPNGWTP